jgi:predicted nucleotidyltransferase
MEKADYIQSDEAAFVEVLDEVLAAFVPTKVPYVVIGGLAITAQGGHRYTHDIDIFCKKPDAPTLLEALAKNGFETQEVNPEWLYKGFKRNVMVDIIFKSVGPVMLEDAMLERSSMIEFKGRQLPVLSLEDLFIMKALVFNEHSHSVDPRCIRHLIDAMSLLRVPNLDWEYILKRAHLGPRRILGLLIYAQSLDLMVPAPVVRTLIEQLGLL